MTASGGFTAVARQRRVTALLTVIACHGLLYLLLRGSTWRAQMPDAPTRAVALRLLPWPAGPAPAARESEAMPRPLARSAPAAITLPSRTSVPAPDGARMQADASPEPALPASQPPRALDLTLPRGFATRPDARNPALDDPRANTARTTPEQRMAAALDTRVIEEDLGNGRRRIRQGDKCVIVQPSRIGQMMPFNDAATRSPSLVGACP